VTVGGHEEEYIVGPTANDKCDPEKYVTILRYRVRKQPEDVEWKSVNAESSSGLPPKVHNRQVRSYTEGDRSALRFDERSGDGIAWWPETNFANGTIEFDVRGKDVFQKSFVGIAFHGVDEKTYDAVYFRPFNFRASDPARRNHAVQYVSMPTSTGRSCAANILRNTRSLSRPHLRQTNGFTLASLWRVRRSASS
jgi:hypothetical protein